MAFRIARLFGQPIEAIFDPSDDLGPPPVAQTSGAVAQNEQTETDGH